MNINNRKLNNEGFTLIELLAVVALLAIVSVVVVFTVSNIINNAKNKSYSVTINNIEKFSETYVLENDKNIMWFDMGNSLYQCVTVENMIDMGYFSNDILESKVSDNRKVLKSDYIFIEKDKVSKSVKSYKLLYNDLGLIENCEYVVNKNDNSRILIEVSNPNSWAQSKEVSITYILDTTVGNMSNYKYNYEYFAYNDDKNIDLKEFDYNTIRSVIKKVNVTDNGQLLASIINKEDGSSIQNNAEVGKIDIARPKVDLGEYTSGVVRGSVTIPIKLTDEQNAKEEYKNGSGVNISSISNSDFRVYIGDSLLTSGVSFDKNNYSLRIENYNYAGKLKIVVLENQILDNVGYGNEKVELNPNIEFTNLYKIGYNACSGNGSMSDTICTYGTNCKLSTNSFTKTGYNFKGWSMTGCDSKNVTYNDKHEFKPFNINNDMILYAVWEKETYNINYDACSGTGAPGSQIKTYGEDLTLSSVKPTRSGYIFVGWSDVDSCSNAISKDYDAGSVYKKNESNVLYAVWKKETYNINYDACSGTGAPGSQIKTYGEDLTLSSVKPTRSGYNFVGWSTSDSCSNAINKDYDAGDTYNKNESVILYAVWEDDTSCYKISAGSGLNCRSSRTTSLSNVVRAFSYGRYVYLSESITENGYTWYYNEDFNCYVVKDYIVYFGETCPSNPPQSSSNPSSSSSSGGGSGNVVCKAPQINKFEYTDSIYCCDSQVTNPLDGINGYGPIGDTGFCYVYFK